jgi:type I restriction enzyme S subunit
VKKCLNHGLNGLKDDTDYSPSEKSVQSINPCKSLIQTGYKQTEMGMIPEEWGLGEIGDLNPFVTSGSRGWAQYYSDRGSAFIRITNLSRQSIYIDLSDLKRVRLPPNDSEGLRTQLQDGDLLVSITADIGIIGFVDSSVPKPAYINQHIALVRFDPNKINSRFLSYFLASEGPQRVFKATTDQGAKAGMNLATVRRISAAFPPSPNNSPSPPPSRM